jgi:hypothetical protein
MTQKEGRPPNFHEFRMKKSIVKRTSKKEDFDVLTL